MRTDNGSPPPPILHAPASQDAAHSFLAEASSVVAAEVVSFLQGFDAKRIAS